MKRLENVGFAKTNSHIPQQNSDEPFLLHVVGFPQNLPQNLSLPTLFLVARCRLGKRVEMPMQLVERQRFGRRRQMAFQDLLR